MSSGPQNYGICRNLGLFPAICCSCLHRKTDCYNKLTFSGIFLHRLIDMTTTQHMCHVASVALSHLQQHWPFPAQMKLHLRQMLVLTVAPLMINENINEFQRHSPHEKLLHVEQKDVLFSYFSNLTCI